MLHTACSYKIWLQLSGFMLRHVNTLSICEMHVIKSFIVYSSIVSYIVVEFVLALFIYVAAIDYNDIIAIHSYICSCCLQCSYQ